MTPGTVQAPEAGSDIRAAGAVALKVVLVYAVFAGLWILLSDKALGWLFSDPTQLVLASTMKGWLFVAVTSLLLFGFIRRRFDQALALSRREAEAQAEKARALQLLAAIADNSSDAIFAKDLEGRYLLCNRETARVFGKTAEEALGRDDTVLFPPEQAALIRANDRRVIDENRINSYEETLSTADGERGYLATKGPLRDDDGKVIGVFGISRDITERQQAEMALRQNIEELECFNRVAVGRELEMIALKQQVNALSRQLGLAPPYALDFADSPAADTRD
ncbi:MAG: PAS domain-containing protein [Sulfuritalea sp.]|nr:PAS domain-containing protein [Sulfuritalea sp.]